MGAYTAGILTLHTEYFKTNPWPSLILGGFVGALLGIAIGAVCFRLRGPYFALATLAATEVARLIVMNSEFTNGAIGITIRVPPPITTPFFTIDFTEKLPYYYITLVIMILSFYAVYTLSKSRYGLLLRSIRDDEDAAMTLGVNAFRLKLFTMFISGFIAGVVGSLYAIYISYIDPAMDPGGVLTLFTSIEPVLITIIGGAATIIGPLIGSVIRVGVGEYLRVIFGWRAGMDLIFFGLIFLIIFFLARKGIWGLIRSRIKIR
jgi:branched-chain amino acid transport system permease protein